MDTENSPIEQIDKKVGKGVFVDSALADYSKPDGYWKGARLRIRTYSWMSRVFEVTGYNASTGKITATGGAEAERRPKT